MKKILALIGAIVAVAAMAGAAAFVAERISEQKVVKSKFKHKPYGIYERFIKRPMDCFLASGAMIVLSPVLLALTVVGAIEMGGNPFFTQERPGKDEKIFKLIKFRTMTNKRDKDGNLLPDTERLTKYGRWLRATSLDELPELFNIVKGEMSIIGPRPLAVDYLPYYTNVERHRHDVCPGLTGLAQANGRNSISWAEKFRYDVEYVRSITFCNDLKIIILTVKKVLVKDGIGQGEEHPGNLNDQRADWLDENGVMKREYQD